MGSLTDSFHLLNLTDSLHLLNLTDSLHLRSLTDSLHLLSLKDFTNELLNYVSVGLLLPADLRHYNSL